MIVQYIPRRNLFTTIKYGLLYNWYAATAPQTVEYGYLYNWYAATDARNISASGWHVPSSTEFQTMLDYLGASGDYNVTNSIGLKVKEANLTYWNNISGVTNEANYNLRGGGLRIYNTGAFSQLKDKAELWTATEFDSERATVATSTSGTSYFECIYSIYERKNTGCSIRLIKDSTTLTHGQTSTYQGNDGRIYNTICIGTQEWLSENLMETKYRNGDAIPEVTDNTAWAALSTGARCSYNNTLSNTGTGSRLTSSDDWVVPTDAQNVILQNYIGGFSNGGKLKETGLTYWDSPNTGATNELGFNGRGTGRWDFALNGFVSINLFYNAWTSSSTNATEAKYSYLGYDNTTFGTGSSIYKVNGNPIRLLYVGAGTPTQYVGNDGKKYRVVTIGTQTWLADNLAETKYRDGSLIPNVTDNSAWAALTTGAMCAYNNDNNNI